MISVVIPLGKNREIEAVESIKKQKNVTHHFIEIGPNPSRNRNAGVKKARTPLVAFINGHTMLSDNWSEEVISFFRRYPSVDIVGGPQLSPPNEKFFGKVSGYALSSLFGAADVSARYTALKEINFNADERSLTSSNLICRRKVFKKIGFDESLYPGEDPKFIEDAKKEGFCVAYSPDIRVFNRRRSTFFSLAKQIFGYGFTRTRKESIFKTLKKPLFLVPSLFVLYLLFLPTLLYISWRFIFPVLLYFALALFFSIHESIKNNNFFALFFLPFVFSTIHISYGAGFIYGAFVNLLK
jgi:succinoglycan biosynthesis protein ExoA